MPAPPPTPRLAFREMTPDDLDDMAALLGDTQVMRYYPSPKSRDEALAWITWNQRLYREYGFGLWLLRLRDSGEFAGDCGLTPQQVDGVTEIEVGYHVRAVLQGRGLATEAAAACRDYARDVLEVNRLIAISDPRNRPSQRVAEKLGLVVERASDNHGRWRSPQRIYVASLERGECRASRASAWATRPAVAGPRPADQPTHDDDRVGQREVALDHPPATLGPPAELAERVPHACVRSTDHRLLAWMGGGRAHVGDVAVQAALGQAGAGRAAVVASVQAHHGLGGQWPQPGKGF